VGHTNVTVTFRNPGAAGREWQGLCLVEATDCLIPAEAVEALGLEPKGEASVVLADERETRLPFAGAEIEFMGGITYGRVLFRPRGAQPLLGVVALESVAERHLRAERDQLAAASEDEPVDLHQRGVALVEGAPQGGEEAGRRCDRLPGESELECQAASLKGREAEQCVDQLAMDLAHDLGAPRTRPTAPVVHGRVDTSGGGRATTPSSATRMRARGATSTGRIRARREGARGTSERGRRF
jgi:predicted aspartyl protease